VHDLKVYRQSQTDRLFEPGGGAAPARGPPAKIRMDDDHTFPAGFPTGRAV
jgi:hypothetical protein